MIQSKNCLKKCSKACKMIKLTQEKSRYYCKHCLLQNCLKALGTNFHPECFCCAYCGKSLANLPFYLEDGLPYCEEGQFKELTRLRSPASTLLKFLVLIYAQKA